MFAKIEQQLTKENKEIQTCIYYVLTNFKKVFTRCGTVAKRDYMIMKSNTKDTKNADTDTMKK